MTAASGQPARPAEVTLDPENPFAVRSSLPYGLPDFAAIRVEHYLPALRAGMAAERAELEAIAVDPSPPTVENTLEAWERSGTLLGRVLAVFHTVLSADSSAALEEIEEIVAPELSAHHDAIFMDDRLHRRLEALVNGAAQGSSVLPPDAARLARELCTDFVRSGVALPAEAQSELREVNAAIAAAEADFGRRLLAGANAAAPLFEDVAELDGLDPDLLASAAEAARERGFREGHLLELQLPTQQAASAGLRRRSARERLHLASAGRGLSGDEHDTRDLVVALARLRARKARLLGHEHYAAYIAADETAGTSEAVHRLLADLAAPAVANARREAAELEAALRVDHPGAGLQPWDWAHYAERLRKERHRLDDADLRPYFELDRVLSEGVFAAAEILYGLDLRPRPDLTGYHPDVRVLEVLDESGRGVGLFLADLHTRPSKRGGAWMNTLVDQSDLLGEQPVVVNTLNLARPAPGRPTLLSPDEVVTLFHEFGHALHALLSRVRYPSQSGTEVPRDVVEFPSQLNEHWAWHPDLLRRYARHVETGEPLPEEWVDALLRAQRFHQGFATTEYLAAAVLDQAWHSAREEDLPVDGAEVEAFEAHVLAGAGLDLPWVPPRYRSTYFHHAFGGDYAAAYYSYVWSEVLDADAVDWFEENGGLSRDAGRRLCDAILSRGGSVDPLQAYRALRGRDPLIGPLLARRGLVAPGGPAE